MSKVLNFNPVQSSLMGILTLWNSVYVADSTGYRKFLALNLIYSGHIFKNRLIIINTTQKSVV